MHYFIILLVMLLVSQPAAALSWSDLWWRKDEQAKRLLDNDKFQQAAKTFESPHWRGIAHYRAGQYYQASKEFANGNSAQSHYNRGNALAHMGYYQDAINAYQQAIELNPSYPDAHHNLKLVKKLLKKQQKTQPKMQARQQKSKTGKQPQKNPQSSPSDGDKRSAKKQDKQQDSRQQQTNNQQKEPQQSNQQQKQQHVNNQQQEKDQSHKQWLRRVPDNPGGLLKNKFFREHLNRHRQGGD